MAGRGIDTGLRGHGEVASVGVSGTRDILDALERLPKKVDRPLLNRSLLVGARLIRDLARQLVPQLQVPDPRRVRGVLRRAIQAAAIRPDEYTATTWVRVRPLTRRQIANFKRKQGKGAANNPNDPFYWIFVEFGTQKMPARPFMRPAFESRKLAAVNAAIDDMRERVQAEIRKLGVDR